MIIKGPDFYMESSISDESDSFDLQVLQHINSKTNPRDELKSAGYGMTMAKCVDKIARNRAARKHKSAEYEDTPMTLKQYHEDYLQAIEEIKIMLHGDPVSKK